MFTKNKLLFVVINVFILIGIFTFITSAMEITKLTMGTAGSTGTFYVVGSAIADVVNKNYSDLNITAEVTGGSVENCRLMSRNEMQLAILSGFVAKDALEGKSPLFNKPIPIRAILTTHPSINQWVVLKSSGLKKISDLKGKKVAVGAPGSSNAVFAMDCLRSHGLDADKGDYKALWFSYPESTEAFQKNQIDCALYAGNLPISAALQVQSFAEIDLLEVDKVDKVIEDYPYFKKIIIPSNVYKNLDHPTTSVYVPSGLYCLADLDENIVYKITKAVYENVEYLKTVASIMEFISLEKAKDVPIELHPGAIKYLREQGVEF